MREVIIKSKIVGREGAIGGGKTIAFPDLSAYALRSDFIRLESSFNDFLEGDDTDNVINRWKELEAFLNNISEDYNLLSLLNGKADKATTLSGYGITDAYTKTNVDDLLMAYVTLSGSQTITGEKNFTGGLKVNGSPIYYDTEKKYWKLEGDLLVTGGVTMYGSDSSFTPSTIMDAILYDDATLGINSNGQLYVKGGTSGGGLDITALQNYLTSNSYLNVTSGDNRYLKLSGGTINVSSGNPYIGYANSGANLGRIGVTTSFEPFFYSSYTGANNTIWHSGNDGSGSGMDADLLDGKHDGELTAIKLYSGGGSIIDANNFTYRDYALRFYSGIPDTSTNLPTTSGYQNGLLVFPIHSNGSTAQLYVSVGKNPYFRSQHTYEWNELAYKTDNVASATKLQTARTIWGQSFDGTGNVTGQLNITTGSNVKLTYGTGLLILGTMASAHIAIDTNDIQAKADGTTASTLYLNNYGGNVSMCGNGGKVGVGTVSPAYKLDVNGTVGFGSSATFYDVISINRNGSSGAILNTSNSALKVECYSTYTSFNTYTGGGTANANVFVLRDNGNVGIGTTSPSAKLHVSSSASYSCIIDSSYTAYGYNYGSVDLRLNNVSKGTIGVNTVPSSLGTSNTAGFYFHNRVSGEYMNFYNEGGTFLKSNLLVNGGITMYSDQRKKTILNHVELSLKQIAEAPLIEHYYNGDEKRTTHVGSIAQYWASMNDWFCKLDSEGFYTMEIQNAALASAISIARELDRYETKTDKAIKKLKMRICELEEEVERLKSA